ncbi:MAG TPA: hypothetical protein VGB70_00980 [Allosphingosinicella sp.]|jgi:hypothetical protein
MRLKLLIALASLAAAPAVAQTKPNEAREMMENMGIAPSPADLKKAIAAAQKYPLGSKLNPVRENMPQGQRAYLARLRCADAQAPFSERLGNIGAGAFGFTVDHFKVTCPGRAPVDVFMDLYHDGPETRPVPGFTMAPAG